MSQRGESGVMLVDLLMALALLALVAGAYYAPIILMLRGTTALQGQLEVQQQPRVALERVVNDLRQASDYTVWVGPPLRLAITKVTALLCQAASGSTSIIVGTAADLMVGSSVTLSAAAVGLSESGKAVTATGSGACPGGATGGLLQISPPLSSAFPTGTLVTPAAPNVTYELNASKQLLRNNAVLAEFVETICLRDRRATLAATVAAGATAVTIVSMSGSCPYAVDSAFAVGDLIFVGSDQRTVTGVSGSTLTLDLGLTQGYAAGALVRRKLLTVDVTIRRAAGTAAGNLVQQVTLTGKGMMRN